MPKGIDGGLPNKLSTSGCKATALRARLDRRSRSFVARNSRSFVARKERCQGDRKICHPTTPGTRRCERKSGNQSDEPTRTTLS
jgi:hypothetical protein